MNGSYDGTVSKLGIDKLCVWGSGVGNGGSPWRGVLGTGACSTGQEPVSGSDQCPAWGPGLAGPRSVELGRTQTKATRQTIQIPFTGNLTCKGWYLFALASDINDKAKELFMKGSL